MAPNASSVQSAGHLTVRGDSLLGEGYPPPVRLYLTTATGVLATDTAPVGGGVAVLEALLPELARRFDTTLVRPGADARVTSERGVSVRQLAVPTLADGRRERLLELDERGYARFALEWEGALGRFFDEVDPTDAVVLANDVSEGPPFAELARLGFAQVVIYHVVVGEFFARRYLRPFGLGPAAATAAGAWRVARRVGLERLLPSYLELVWTKEEAAARHALAICPSSGLADSLAALYPATGIPERTHVVPWGVIGSFDPDGRRRRTPTLAALGVDPRRKVLLTMSRLSPEKRLELAIDAVSRWERTAPDRARDVALVLAGAPAYMNGHAYARRIERRARRLAHASAHFVGYVSGASKPDLLSAADLFVSTSSYEAYGLGIAQALAAGTPVVATDHDGARAILANTECGRVCPPSLGALARAFDDVLREDFGELRARAAAWGASHPFDRAAERVATILTAARAALDGA